MQIGFGHEESSQSVKGSVMTNVNATANEVRKAPGVAQDGLEAPKRPTARPGMRFVAKLPIGAKVIRYGQWLFVAHPDRPVTEIPSPSGIGV